MRAQGLIDVLVKRLAVAVTARAVLLVMVRATRG